MGEAAGGEGARGVAMGEMALGRRCWGSLALGGYGTVAVWPAACAMYTYVDCRAASCRGERHNFDTIRQL